MTGDGAQDSHFMQLYSMGSAADAKNCVIRKVLLFRSIERVITS
jgi:hypothetical protein